MGRETFSYRYADTAGATQGSDSASTAPHSYTPTPPLVAYTFGVEMDSSAEELLDKVQNLEAELAAALAATRPRTTKDTTQWMEAAERPEVDVTPTLSPLPFQSYLLPLSSHSYPITPIVT